MNVKIECTYMKLSIIIHPLFRFKLVTLLHGQKVYVKYKKDYVEYK